MNVTSKKVDDLNLVLTVKVEAADYDPARKKKLKDMQRRAEVPGFRKGHVPASLVEKWYGNTALGDAVNEVVSQALQEYVENEKLNIIGEPLPSSDKLDQEWVAGNDFSFDFDVALTPTVDFEIDKTDELPMYSITVTEAEKKKLVEAFKKQNENADEEYLTKQVAEQLKSEYKQAAEYRLEKDIRDYCVKKAALEVPDKFLRRWLIAANDGKYTVEQIDKDFDAFLDDYRWQLVMGFLTKKYSIQVTEADLKEEAELFAKYQYAMYGISNIPEEALQKMVDSILQDSSNLQRMGENVQARKVIAAVKENLTVKSKKISADKFRELK